jgi:hypothetical protein
MFLRMNVSFLSDGSGNSSFYGREFGVRAGFTKVPLRMGWSLTFICWGKLKELNIETGKFLIS